MKIKFLPILLAFQVLFADDLIDKIKTDRTLIVPGIGAEGIPLNVELNTLYKQLPGKSYNTAKFSNPQELFKKVFKVETDIKIYFDYIYYYRHDKLILFSNGGKSTAVIGFRTDRVTIDSVSLDKGSENFILNYGNKGLTIIENKSGKVYLYKKLGIAIFDDKADGTIDMYLVFKINAP